MNFKTCREYIKSDLSRMVTPSAGKCIQYLLFNASFKVTFWFRLGSYLQAKKGLFFRMLYLPVFLIYKRVQFKTGIQLPFGTQVGKGLCFSHFSCIVINSGAIIGDFCTIFQGVTIGSKRGKKGGTPVLGDYVVVASGAKIIGKLSVGNSAMIGANAVVVKDIPAHAVVVGNPAQVVNMNGKYHTELYLKN